jgi:HAD superfamily phosphoserine phosphatase-like hydrolase
VPPAPKTPFELVAFDVDGTLIDSPEGLVVWQLLNRRFGGSANFDAGLFHAFLRKEITYAEWVDLDIRGWQTAGASRTEIAKVILSHLRLVPGARETVEELVRRGLRLAVISGTLDMTLDLLFPGHPFEVVFTNRIWFDGSGRIAGWEATPYDMEGKALGLEKIAERMGISLARTVYVGDNINDVKVMSRAGLAVAFEPKHPSVEEAAHVVVRGDLRGLLAHLG